MNCNRIIYGLLAIGIVFIIAAFFWSEGSARGEHDANRLSIGAAGHKPYQFPNFYRGIYLSNDSACDPDKFNAFLDSARSAHINTFVMDVQTAKYQERIAPSEHIGTCISRGIHPVARVVVFPGGLALYPPEEKTVSRILGIAERAAKTGFKEIQFDYIRFSDENRHAVRLKGVGLAARYRCIENFLVKARSRLKPYRVKISVDIFGRVPHHTDDRIGQKMEVFDPHVDIICPMAYPSHYWTKKLRNDPYGTVLWTSSEADRRTEKARVVVWIQAFKMRQPRGMSFGAYIHHQIRAVHDADIHGFLLWNARQNYSSALKALSAFYRSSGRTGKYAL